MDFASSYLGGLRALVGNRPLLSVGVRVLVEDSFERFLVTRRSDTGLWCLPGGSMELGESLVQAAHREVREEANLELQQLEPFGLSSDPLVERHTYPNGDVVQNISLLVHARLLSGNLASNDGEATEFRFCLPSEIDEASFVTTEFATFRHWQNYKRSGAFQIV